MASVGDRDELAVVVVEAVREPLIGPLNEDQRLGIVDRDRLQDGGVDQAEDGGVGAEADGEREHDRQRQRRRLAQLAQTVAGVLPRRLNPSDDAHGSRLLFDQGDVAEAQPRAPRVVLALGQHGEVELQLLVDLRVVPLAAQRAGESRP
jgi:hypothetical protein